MNNSFGANELEKVLITVQAKSLDKKIFQEWEDLNSSFTCQQ